MMMKLSEYQKIGGLNKTASALILENNISVNSPDDFESFFPDILNKKSVNTFTDFFNTMSPLEGTDEFIKIVNTYKGKKLCILSDYDCDGIMSAVILYISLKNILHLFEDIEIRIPDRLKEKYGASEELVRGSDADIYITADNGIGLTDVCSLLHSYGKEFIVTDHHLPDDDNASVPSTLIIDPKYNHDKFSDICGAVVVLKLMVALIKASSLDVEKSQALDVLGTLASIATIADCMPVLNENRFIIKLGLAQINKCKFSYNKNSKVDSTLYNIFSLIGGKDFLRNTDIATEEFISFYISPTVNAVSRVDGVVMPLVKDIIVCFSDFFGKMPFSLSGVNYKNINYQRQSLTRLLLEDYKPEKTDATKNCEVVLFKEDNYAFEIKGILGLISNKVLGSSGKPSLVGRDNLVTKEYDFSGRSNKKYNLHDGIMRLKEQYPELKITGGGHANAMGISFSDDEGNLEKFKAALSKDIAENSHEINENIFIYEPKMEDEIISTMAAYQPYGIGFSKLKFQYTGEFKYYDYDSKIATIGDYEFKIFLGRVGWKKLVGKDYTILFSMSFNKQQEVVFNNIKD